MKRLYFFSSYLLHTFPVFVRLRYNVILSKVRTMTIKWHGFITTKSFFVYITNLLQFHSKVFFLHVLLSPVKSFSYRLHLYNNQI